MHFVVIWKTNIFLWSYPTLVLAYPHGNIIITVLKMNTRWKEWRICFVIFKKSRQTYSSERTTKIVFIKVENIAFFAFIPFCHTESTTSGLADWFLLDILVDIIFDSINFVDFLKHNIPQTWKFQMFLIEICT